MSSSCHSEQGKRPMMNFHWGNSYSFVFCFDGEVRWGGAATIIGCVCRTPLTQKKTRDCDPALNNDQKCDTDTNGAIYEATYARTENEEAEFRRESDAHHDLLRRPFSTYEE